MRTWSRPATASRRCSSTKSQRLECRRCRSTSLMLLAIHVGLPALVCELNQATLADQAAARRVGPLRGDRLMIRPQREVSDRLTRMAAEAGYPPGRVSPYIADVLAEHVGLHRGIGEAAAPAAHGEKRATDGIQREPASRTNCRPAGEGRHGTRGCARRSATVGSTCRRAARRTDRPRGRPSRGLRPRRPSSSGRRVKTWWAMSYVAQLSFARFNCGLVPLQSGWREVLRHCCEASRRQTISARQRPTLSGRPGLRPTLSRLRGGARQESSTTC